MSRPGRRAFIGTLGAAAVALPELGASVLGASVGGGMAAAAAAQGAATYDLLIKGGKVIDAAQNLSAERDVAISRGKIAAVAANIPANQAREVFDARGRLVTPGLINTHAHVYRDFYPISTDPDMVGIPAGVTTIIDAGSPGASTYAGFKRYIIEQSAARIFAMLNISSIGNFGNELYLGLQVVDPKAAIRTVNANKDRILAIKVRINGNSREVDHDFEVMTRARQASDTTGLPLMVHWTNEPRLLGLLKQGDILTHPFNIPQASQSNMFGGAPGRILPQILELKQRGIWIESQAVNSHHLWENSEKGFAEGFRPDLISTDLGAVGARMPYGLLLPWTMNHYLHLGMTIEQVVERVTLAPTKVFKFPEKTGTLEVGVNADVTVINLEQGAFELSDQRNNKRTAKQRIIPVAAVVGGVLTRLDSIGHR